MADKLNDPTATASNNTSAPTNTGSMASNNMKDTLKSATQETQPKMMDAQGAVGKQFTADGAIGGTAQKVGGPFDKDGMIGKHFNADGALGGTVQANMGGEKKA